MLSVARNTRDMRFPVRPIFGLIAKLPVLALLALFWRRALPRFLRRALADMGPVYIKLGQVLSTRSDVLRPEYQEELATLREHVPTEPHALMRSVLERSLPRPVDQVFSRFEEQPIAAGAVAQVYAAELAGGTKVAVKILRPNIRAAVDANFRLLHFVARLLARLSARVRALNVTAFLAELHELLLTQCDLGHEVRNYRRFRAAFSGSPEVVIPKVYEDLSSSEVLVMEFIEAIKPDDFRRLGIPALELAKRIDTMFDVMIFLRGLCHADLHPGNFFWNRKGQVVLIDLGLVHEIPPEESRHFAAFYYAIIDGFFDFAASYMIDNFLQPAASPGAARELTEVIRAQFVDTGGKPSFSRIFEELIATAVRHGLEFRPTYSKMCLTAVTVEGYLYALDPSFDMIENARHKRLDLARYTSIPAEAEALIFQDFGTYSTALFGPGASPEKAFEARDAHVLDMLALGPGELFIDVGCGRGRLLEKAVRRGARGIGITISPDERDICIERGSECILSSWENFDLDHPSVPTADAMAVVEMFNHVATMHESMAGLMQLRLDRFFDWAARRLKPGGKLFLQSLCVEHRFITDPSHRAELDELCRTLPFAGFPTLQQILLAAGRGFTVRSAVDHSEDVGRTYRYFLGRIDGNAEALRSMIRPDVFDPMYEQLKYMLRLADRRILGLNRVLLSRSQIGEAT